MALISCGECGKEISDKAAACPHCGAPVASEAPQVGRYYQDMPPPVMNPPKSGGSSWWKWVIGIPAGGFALLVLIGSCSGNTPQGKAKSAQQSAIELCWKDFGKKSNDPDTARFIASTCEKMEADARK